MYTISGLEGNLFGHLRSTAPMHLDEFPAETSPSCRHQKLDSSLGHGASVSSSSISLISKGFTLDSILGEGQFVPLRCDRGGKQRCSSEGISENRRSREGQPASVQLLQARDGCAKNLTIPGPPTEMRLTTTSTPKRSAERKSAVGKNTGWSGKSLERPSLNEIHATNRGYDWLPEFVGQLCQARSAPSV